MKKISALLLAVLFCVFALFSCENVEYITDESGAEEETVSDIYDELLSTLPDISDSTSGGNNLPDTGNYRKFYVATDNKTVFDGGEDNSGSVNKATKDRNEFLKEKYGIEIVAENENPKNIAENIKSGTNKYDLLAFSARATANLYIHNLLYDMNRLPDFVIDDRFFDAKLATSLATNKTLYMMPDATAQIYDNIYVMFFNRDLVAKTNISDPETLVQQGKWTWDSMNEIMKQASTSMHKSGADINKDIFGYGAYNREGSFPTVMWASSGKPYIKDTYRKEVKLSLTTDEIVENTANLYKYYNSKALMPVEKNDLANAFLDNRLVFMCHRLDYLKALRDGTEKGKEFGILPMPKLYESQENYSCYVSADSRILSVPKDPKDPKLTSAVLTANSAAGRDTQKNAFINSYIAMYLNTNAETVMLKTILDSMTFDFCAVYGSEIREIRYASTNAVINALDVGDNIRNTLNYRIRGFNEALEKYFNNSP